jgi:hypothetical protein
MIRADYVGNKFRATYKMDGETFIEVSFVSMDLERAREVAKEIGRTYFNRKYNRIHVEEGDFDG